jgi:type VI secretion system VasD/TssJ family lipoprotein
MIDSRVSRPALAHARVLCAGLVLVSCGAAQIPHCDSPEVIKLHLQPAKHLNPDRAGLPRSVVVRFYQLSETRGFESSSFDRVWSEGEGLPEAQQLVLLPGRGKSHALPRDPSARYLAVAANFRQREDDSHWRALVRLPAAQDSCDRWVNEHAPAIELTLTDYALELR